MVIKGQGDRNEQERRIESEREKTKQRPWPAEGSRGAITISKRRKLKPHCWEPNSVGGATGGLTREDV